MLSYASFAIGLANPWLENFEPIKQALHRIVEQSEEVFQPNDLGSYLNIASMRFEAGALLMAEGFTLVFALIDLGLNSLIDGIYVSTNYIDVLTTSTLIELVTYLAIDVPCTCILASFGTYALIEFLRSLRKGRRFLLDLDLLTLTLTMLVLYTLFTPFIYVWIVPQL